MSRGLSERVVVTVALVATSRAVRRLSVIGYPGPWLQDSRKRLEPLGLEFFLVTHLAQLLRLSLLLGQDTPSQVPQARIRMLAERVELRPTSARNVEAVVQEPLDVERALAVLALLHRQTRAIATEVSGVVAAGEALARPPAPAAPAEMASLPA